MEQVFKGSNYLRISFVLFLFTIGYSVYYSNELFRNPIWIYDTGTYGDWFVQEMVNTDNHTIVNLIYEEYLFNSSDTVRVKLESTPYTYDAKVFARGIINFSLPYDLSVSANKKTFKSVNLKLPFFISYEMAQRVKEVLKSWKNITFKEKTYFVADIIEWYITFPYQNGTLYLEIQWKKAGFLDGILIRYSEKEFNESIFIVSAAPIKPKYVDEYNHWNELWFGMLGLIFLTVLPFGLYIRKKIREKVKDVYEEVEKALSRIDKYSEKYVVLWKIASLTCFILGILSILSMSFFEIGSDIVFAIAIGFAVLISVIIGIFYFWMINLIGLEKEFYITGSNITLPTMLTALGLLEGILIGAAIENKNVLFGLGSIALLLVIYLIARYMNAEKELKRFVEELKKKKEAPGLLGIQQEK